jgi:hypothetical protein
MGVLVALCRGWGRDLRRQARFGVGEVRRVLLPLLYITRV